MTGNDRDSPDDAPRNPRTTVRRGDDRSAASSDLSRRTLLGAVAAVGIAWTSGCLTLGPTAKVSGLSGSKVFESVSVSEPWASGRVAASVELTRAATTRLGVRGLTVVRKDGTEFDTTAVRSGQTKKTVFLPVGRATLTAVDFDGWTVGRVAVAVRGKKVV